MMPNFQIPESVVRYYSDRKIRSAVDALVDALEGDKMPECTWEEAQSYNKALLMAAQVRADFNALLFRLWDATWGQAKPGRLTGDYFEWDSQSPQKLWENRNCMLVYYRDGNPDNGGKSDCLFASLEEGNVSIQVQRWTDNKNVAPHPGPIAVAGWELRDAHEAWPYFENQSLSVPDFLSAPDETLRRFQDDAKRMIDALLED